MTKAERTPETAINHFHLSELFPDASMLLSSELSELDQAKRNAIFVLDTNVLLIPYHTKTKALDLILKTYTGLCAEGRLIVPAQVIREFAKNRPDKLKDLYHQLASKKGQSKSIVPSPLLEALPEFDEVHKTETQLREANAKFQEAVDKVLAKIRSWRWDDPVTVGYRDTFRGNVIVDRRIGDNDLVKDLHRRVSESIPPGYKDSGKADEGIGDVIIWHTILEIGEDRKQDVIFVTGEEKSDWWHKSSGEPLYPRFELADEFRRRSGARFNILRFSDFLQLFGVPADVVCDVEREEASQSLEVAPKMATSSELPMHCSEQFFYFVKQWALENWRNCSINSRGSSLRSIIGEGEILDILVVTMKRLKLNTRQVGKEIASINADHVGIVIEDAQLGNDLSLDKVKSMFPECAEKIRFVLSAAFSKEGGLIFKVWDSDSNDWFRGRRRWGSGE